MKIPDDVLEDIEEKAAAYRARLMAFAEKRWAKRKQKPPPRVWTPVELLFMSIRAARILEEMMIKTIDDFLVLTEQQLLAHKTCGQKTASEIAQVQGLIRSGGIVWDATKKEWLDQ